MRRTRLIVLLAALTGCAPKAWETHPLPVAPDRACRTGSDGGHDVWIWDCHAGQRTVIFQFCRGMVGCSEAEREDIACGQTTAFERANESELKVCRPVPDMQVWASE